MELCWIKITSGLQNAVELINNADKVKFQQLFTHVVESSSERSDTGLFTADELTSLEKVLNLETNNVTLLIKSIRHIIKRMTKFIMRPSFILNDLTNILKMDEDKAQLFVNKYKVLIKNTAEDFNISNFGNIEEITKPSWQVNLEMTSSKNQLERNTCTLINLQTNQKESIDKHCIEFDIDELKNFHQQIEAIQNEIDCVINT